ncbi:2'-5' RNA ligase [Arcticibacter tournemirensis]|nr:2'-5' RNA ligase family protein [Arcticibacter tournemirensis]TQM51538.1 2'-5' RNA ligase [Arcticibacter tournemirensis]
MSLYLTAILPPAPLAEEIDEIRKEISEKYRVYKALRPPVHVTLFRPVNIDDDIEKYLIQWLKPVCHLHNPFEQQLENYDSFNNHTVYIRVPKSALLQALQKDISAVFNKNKIDPPEMKGNTSFNPHVTVAYRDVSPEVFAGIWEEYKNKKFRRSFTIDKFTLLKHDGHRWNILKEFPLQKPEILQLF